MNRFIIYLLCTLICSIGLTGTLKGQGIPAKSSTSKQNSSFKKKKAAYPVSTKNSTSTTTQKTKQADGTAFTCPAAKWSGSSSDFYYHLTLTHITTQDPNIVKLVRKTIQSFVAANVPMKNGHRSLSWKQGTQGVSSLFFKGEAADFKLDLHNHLMQNPAISPYISPYIGAHVDVRGDFSKKLYSSFTVDQLIERKTH